MKKIETVEEMQKIALDILIFIDAFCREHDLKYFIVDGTLLGAVRHHGFIPWDDDIDIWMPREDYDKITELLGPDSGSRYQMVNLKNASWYRYAFGKILDTRTRLVRTTDTAESSASLWTSFPTTVCRGKRRRIMLRW